MGKREVRSPPVELSVSFLSTCCSTDISFHYERPALLTGSLKTNISKRNNERESSRISSIINQTSGGLWNYNLLILFIYFFSKCYPPFHCPAICPNFLIWSEHLNLKSNLEEFDWRKPTLVDGDRSSFSTHGWWLMAKNICANTFCNQPGATSRIDLRKSSAWPKSLDGGKKKIKIKNQIPNHVRPASRKLCFSFTAITKEFF